MTAWLEDRETKCYDCHRDNVLWGVDIADMTAKVLATSRVGETALTQKARKEARDETARQEGKALGASPPCRRSSGTRFGGVPTAAEMILQHVTDGRRSGSVYRSPLLFLHQY